MILSHGRRHRLRSDPVHNNNSPRNVVVGRTLCVVTGIYIYKIYIAKICMIKYARAYTARGQVQQSVLLATHNFFLFYKLFFFFFPNGILTSCKVGNATTFPSNVLHYALPRITVLSDDSIIICNTFRYLCYHHMKIEKTSTVISAEKIV